MVEEREEEGGAGRAAGVSVACLLYVVRAHNSSYLGIPAGITCRARYKSTSFRHFE